MIYSATLNDMNDILELDHHIGSEILAKKITNNEVYVIKDNDVFIGTLRFSLFWDNTPFMNLLYIKPEYQKKGYGSLLVKYWESKMKDEGYKLVMTSTLSNESAQHFYRKEWYKDIGGFVMPDEPLELLFIKEISV